MKTEREMFDLFAKIAINDERIRAAYIHGSRANPSALRDGYSDYDVVFVVTETGSFIDDKKWLNNFGDISLSVATHWIQNKFFGRDINDLLRRYNWSMLFKDGNRIDLLVEIIDEAMNSDHIKNKPTKILLDKDGCLPELPLLNDEDCIIKKPHKDEYTACCSGFWWFLTNVAKGIARDQLPFAKEQFNSFNVLTLNRMADWYIGVQTDFSDPIGEGGKCYKKYLPADVYDLYTKIYSDSDYQNFWNAVFSACELFGKIAREVGDFFGFIYNKQDEENMMDYLVKVRNGIQRRANHA